MGVLLKLSGCASRHCSQPSVVTSGSCAQMLPACARGDFPGELKLLTTDSPEILGRLKATPPGPRGRYRLLAARQCQCLAAAASTLANMLDLEGQFTVEKADAKILFREKVQQGAALKVDSLTYLALEDRNRSAGKALDLYYRLGAAEASSDVLQSMLTQVGDALAKARALKAKGLQVPVDEPALLRQHLELQSQNVKLELQIKQFNGELRRQLAFEPCESDWQFWPAEAFHRESDRLAGDCVDPEKAVAVGLGTRPMLLLLNMLETELSEGDPATVRHMLSAINNMLGQEAKCPCLKELVAILCGTSAEQQLRQQQLALYRADREREVVEDIRQAARTIEAQRGVVLLAHHKAESWLGRVTEAEEKETKGLGSFAETSEAKVNWLKARRTVAEETINMQRAWVQLRQAQGILPAECLPQAAPPDWNYRAATISAVETLPPPRPVRP